MAHTRPNALYLAMIFSIIAILVTGCSAAPASTPLAASPAAVEAASAVTLSPAAPVSFSKDILPIFEASCIKCHGGDKTEKGLDLKTYSSLMSGSQRGQVLVPGDSSRSRLTQLIAMGKMPKRGEKLSSQELQLIVDWIDAGAQNN